MTPPLAVKVGRTLYPLLTATDVAVARHAMRHASLIRACVWQCEQTATGSLRAVTKTTTHLSIED